MDLQNDEAGWAAFGGVGVGNSNAYAVIKQVFEGDFEHFYEFTHDSIGFNIKSFEAISLTGSYVDGKQRVTMLLSPVWTERVLLIIMDDASAIASSRTFSVTRIVSKNGLEMTENRLMRHGRDEATIFYSVLDGKWSTRFEF